MNTLRYKLATNVGLRRTLRNEHYANGDAIPGDLSDGEWAKCSSLTGRSSIYNNDSATLLITAACTTGTRWMTRVACVRRLARADGWRVYDA